MGFSLRTKGREEMSERELIERVRRAIYDPGSHPEHHMATMERHRKEWPVLWAALDALLDDPREVEG